MKERIIDIVCTAVLLIWALVLLSAIYDATPEERQDLAVIMAFY